MSFPSNFIWGAAAASYQVEGAAFDDGKSASVWDMFCRKEGTIFNGHTGDVACDHYHRYKEDVALMKSLNIQAYRLSISWPRVLPAGSGTVNSKGLDFYDRLVDELLDAGIKPFVTLFHWDFPYELYCRGGWLNPASPDWFAEYTAVVANKLSDRVQYWMTLNEPQCTVELSHQKGIHAPGDKLGMAELLRIAHNLLLAHGKSVMALRAASKLKSNVGFAPVGVTFYPATSKPEDVEAARQMIFSIPNKTFWTNTWFADPIVLGKYPEDGLAVFNGYLPEMGPDDMSTICQPLDFYGVNIYQGTPMRMGADGKPEVVPLYVGHPIAANKWPLTPDALYWGPYFLWERYKLPIFITENGMAGVDWVALDGGVHDPQRIDFTARYLHMLEHAIDDGVPVQGYFHWSILDNFEWAEGYKERFGMVYVDFRNQKRIPKDSAYWYRDVIASNGGALH